MKNKLVCVFAHPDDEAFGPGGTIAKFTKDHDVYVLCATRGEAGGNNHNSNISEIRPNELLESARILGVKKVFFLGFTDGQLCNSIYHELAKKITAIIKKLKPENLLTFEPRGVSGHIDHITVSMVTSYVFIHSPIVKTLYFFCLTEELVKEEKKLGDYFIYFPPGYKKSEINKTIGISDFWETKVKAMSAHQSQKEDVKTILSYLKKMPKEEHFLVLKR